jgi:Mn-dependent DtxR family transcriptional regulator
MLQLVVSFQEFYQQLLLMMLRILKQEELIITTFSRIILKRLMTTNSISDLLKDNGNYYAVLNKLKELKSQELVIYDGDFIMLTNKGEYVSGEMN